MSEEVKTPEKTFTFVFAKSDVETILAGLGELPSKYSHELLNKMEMVMVAQSKDNGNS